MKLTEKEAQAFYDDNVRMAKIISEYRKFFMSLLEAKQKVYDLNEFKPPDRINVVSIDKEEYERWQKVQKIIDDATFKGTQL